MVGFDSVSAVQALQSAMANEQDPKVRDLA